LVTSAYSPDSLLGYFSIHPGVQSHFSILPGYWVTSAYTPEYWVCEWCTHTKKNRLNLLGGYKDIGYESICSHTDRPIR
jgi:hypothetical protein